MKRYILPFLYILVLTLTACRDHDEVQDRRTVIVYMMAENSLSRLAQSDITEMISASVDIPKDCNLVIYLDDTHEPAIYTIGSGKSNTQVWKELPEHNSADSAVFQQNLQQILRKFPADHYGLVLWSHGSGWTARRKTIGIDNQKNNETNIGAEMEIPALRGALEHCAVHWDYILFDACFMQCVEVAYELRHLTDWCIGSPAEIPGLGAPYHKIMAPMMNGDAQQIVENYFRHYAYGDGLVISAARTREMEALAEATRNLVSGLFANRTSVPTYGIQPYCPWGDGSCWQPEFFDMGSAMGQLADADSYAQWLLAAQRAVPYHQSSAKWYSIYQGFSSRIFDPEHILGMSMFIPQDKYEGHQHNSDFQQTQWYKAAGWDQTGW